MQVKGLEQIWQQIGLIILVALATLLGLASGIMALIDALHSIGIYLGIGGFLAFVGAIAWARETSALPLLHQKERGVGPTRAAIDWQVLRVTALLLNLMIITAVIVLFLELLASGGATNVARQDILVGLASISNAVISVVLGFALFQSLRTDYDIARSTYRNVFSILFLAGGAILALGTIGFSTGQNAPFMLLASIIFVSLGAFAWRDLPNLYGLVTEERSMYRSGGRITRTRSTIVPTLIAFGLLFVVLLLFMLFGATTVGRLTDVLFRPSFLVLAAIMILAIVGSVGAVAYLGRKREQQELELYEEVPDERLTTKRTILYTSVGLAILAALFALLVGLGVDLFGMRPGRWVDLLAVSAMLGVGPYGFYIAHEYARIRRLEERFPDFLRDIASSHRGGLTLPSAVAIAARGEYGPLTPEVQRMADQMTWNVSFDEALDRFSQRVATPLIQRTVSLVQEASRSGGSTSEVLLAAARDARQLKNMENDRRLSMTLYGVIIYITFFVFLLVAAVLHNQFVPQIIASAEALEAAGNVGGFTISVVTLDEYRAFYFLSSMVQGLGGGMVAGMMATGRAVMGLRHAFIMVFIAFITFVLFLV